VIHALYSVDFQSAAILDRPSPSHVSIAVRDVAAATRWFAALGLREIAEGEDFAVLELPRGTHLVVERAARRNQASKGPPSISCMMISRRCTGRCQRLGIEGHRACRDGRPPVSFIVAGPEGYRVTINSSHAGKRPV